jgi:hypothetical protein
VSHILVVVAVAVMFSVPAAEDQAVVAQVTEITELRTEAVAVVVLQEVQE